MNIWKWIYGYMRMNIWKSIVEKIILKCTKFKSVYSNVPAHLGFGGDPNMASLPPQQKLLLEDFSHPSPLSKGEGEGASTMIYP